MTRAALVFTTLLGYAAANAAIVYNNTQNYLVAWIVNQGPAEAADLLTLGGEERALTGIEATLRLYTLGTMMYSLAFRVYELDAKTGLPGVVLAEKTELDLKHDANGPGVITRYMDMPNIQMSDDVVVGAKIFDVSGDWEYYGIAAANPPSIGSSDPSFFYWHLEGEGWARINSPNSWGNLRMVVHAVPEPATVAALAGLALVALRRRRQ